MEVEAVPEATATVVSSTDESDETIIEAEVVNEVTPSKKTSAKKSPSKKTPTKKTPSKKSKSSTSATETPTKKKTPSKSSTPASPKISYVKLVADAIVALKDRTGSSKPAIEKYILSAHPEIPAEKIKQRLLHTLRTGVTNKRFIKVKASYKIHPSVKKSSKSKKKPALSQDKKSLSKAELAALREKERQDAKEKERLDRIRKRKFPMDDLKLIVEDKELKVNVKRPAKPTNIPLLLPEFPAANKSDSMGSGILDDIFHIYHFFRGDLGWGRLPAQKKIVAPFTLDQLISCVQQIMLGGAKKSRMLPPLLTHLFVVCLQHLVPDELQSALTPSSWSEVLMMYMDAMERFYTTELSQDDNAQPGLPIDTEFLLGVSNEHKSEDLLAPPVTRSSEFYLMGSLTKIHNKLFTHDPWLLSAEEICTLLKTLVDDMMASLEECGEVLDERIVEVYELLKQKRDSDAAYRKVQYLRGKEEREEKLKSESDEKATRSNTNLPSVSDAQIESARRSQQRSQNAYDVACRRSTVRTEPVGQDRNYHSFYHFWNDPHRAYIMQRGKAMPSTIPSVKIPGCESHRTTCHSIDKRSVLEQYMESLDTRGVRERGLHQGLSCIAKLVTDDVKAMNDRKKVLQDKKNLQRRLENAKRKCEFGRKSGRLAAQSEEELSLLQHEIDTLERSVANNQAPVVVDLERDTGLSLLRSFDDQDTEELTRRKTRRDTQEEDTEEDPEHIRFSCSLLWSTGGTDGSGVIGGLVSELLDLENRVQRLATWENYNRKEWRDTLESLSSAWHQTSPPSMEVKTKAVEVTSPEGSDKKNRLSVGTPGSVASLSSGSMTTAQTVAVLKHPVLDLENRLFVLTGLAMASSDADAADDNMSANAEDSKEFELQTMWKRVISRLNRIPAKSHSKIRQAVVDAISAARKAHQPMVVQQLRNALLQFHPQAAGSCKAEALKILDEHGGFDDEDDDDDDAMEEDRDPEQEVVNDEQRQSGLSAALCAEAVILNSSLDGQEDASRTDWINAVRKVKTVSKMAALVSAFCSKTSKKLDKIEDEQYALEQAIEAWEKSLSSKKKKGAELIDPSEVWANVKFTNDFCLVRVESYPLWPARKCLPKDEDLASTLKTLERSLVSLVGEGGGLRVVKTESILPFSESLPTDEDNSGHSRELRNQLDECMAMTRRIMRGI